MSLEPTRPAEPSTDADPARQGTIESLLVAGLEAYFAGELERAIHIWTRVLFLDRGHARAKAYIDRARVVQAERQRETDELVHGGIAAFDDGDAPLARRLLTTAVRQGQGEDMALALLSRIERLESAATPAVVRGETLAVTPRSVAAARAPRRSSVGLVLLSLALLVAVFVLGWDRFQEWQRAVPEQAAARVAAATTREVKVPRLAALSVARARALFTRGHLHEALHELDAVPPGDALRPEADRLSAEIQHLLLAAVPAAPLEDAAPPVAEAPAR
jgi:predicted negative regulator of RcsB-dependent stress response